MRLLLLAAVAAFATSHDTVTYFRNKIDERDRQPHERNKGRSNRYLIEKMFGIKI